MNRILGHIGLVLYALQFLTRLPVRGAAAHAPARLGEAAFAFPLVGLVVGGIGAAVWAGATALGVPPLAGATLALGATLLVTGALHEDGLADIADGLGGGADRARALDIMRDSRIGAYGAAALGISLVLRVACLSALTLWPGALALVIAHVAGRTALLVPLVSLPYARAEGLGLATAGARPGTLLVALAFAAPITALAGEAEGLAALLAALGAGLVVRARLQRRLQGFTGDGLGAAEQAGEMAALVVLAALWS